LVNEDYEGLKAKVADTLKLIKKIRA
jgi:hypothetical protein